MQKSEIQNLIKDLIEKTTISVTDITANEEDPKNVWYSVEVDNPHPFIWRDGEALFALNHIVRKVLESKMPRVEQEPEIRVLVDINGFQKKRIDSLRAVAHMMAERARYFKSSVEVDPMPAFERRIVHEFLSGATDLKTESSGFGPNRRVVIKYIGSI